MLATRNSFAYYATFPRLPPSPGEKTRPLSAATTTPPPSSLHRGRRLHEITPRWYPTRRCVIRRGIKTQLPTRILHPRKHPLSNFQRNSRSSPNSSPCYRRHKLHPRTIATTTTIADIHWPASSYTGPSARIRRIRGPTRRLLFERLLAR